VLRRLLSPRWLALHLLALVLVAACLRLGWWQWQRAGQGNMLSYGYALEWPAFAVFVVVIWGYLVRDALRAHRSGQHGAATVAADPAPQDAGQELLPTDAALLAARAAAAATEDDDEELAAYNDYLARLNAADPRRKRS
jgi:DNA-binding transcriptional regulator of glucitol operon